MILERFTKMTGALFLTFSLFLAKAEATEDTRAFSPASGVKAIITTDAKKLSWKVDYGGSKSHGRIDIATENTIHVDVDDYDFSGHLGFAVWHTDDGMGTYSIYRVFTFSPSTKKFIEQGPESLCGDEFINLKIDRKKQRLFSTYWDKNVAMTCITRLLPTK